MNFDRQFHLSRGNQRILIEKFIYFQIPHDRRNEPGQKWIFVIFRSIFFDFFEISKNRSKNQKRNGSWKWSIMLRFEPGFHGFVGLGLLYKSVQFRLKTEHFWAFSGPISIGRDFSSDFFRFLRNLKKSLEKSKKIEKCDFSTNMVKIEMGLENDQKCSVLNRNFTDL